MGSLTIKVSTVLVIENVVVNNVFKSACGSNDAKDSMELLGADLGVGILTDVLY